MLDDRYDRRRKSIGILLRHVQCPLFPSEVRTNIEMSKYAGWVVHLFVQHFNVILLRNFFFKTKNPRTKNKKVAKEDFVRKMKDLEQVCEAIIISTGQSGELNNNRNNPL